ncbi:hypothetical protein CO683_40665 [Bradyrhizobium ottawaense]|nr:hypothetical protein [Bradyrhizobium sp. CCBAU 11386]MDA9537046.1 hypothetical protein [Bradyrhizobium sp. CCBAU 21362]PDT64053.1 hypothetical protein CO683_40665 [Bradyrhizobium ottawaense]
MFERRSAVSNPRIIHAFKEFFLDNRLCCFEIQLIPCLWVDIPHRRLGESPASEAPSGRGISSGKLCDFWLLWMRPEPECIKVVRIMKGSQD